MQGSWPKTFWIQSVESVVLPGYRARNEFKLEYCWYFVFFSCKSCARTRNVKSFSTGPVVTGGLLPASCSQTNRLLYSQPVTTVCLTYSAYAGIYPQATPLEQVESALKQSSTVTSTNATATATNGTVHNSSSNAAKRHPQKRRFQEAPTTLILAAGTQQGPAPHEISSSVEKKSDISRPCTYVKTQRPLAPFQTSTSYPSSKSMPPPPPSQPPKFPSSMPSLKMQQPLAPSQTSTSYPSSKSMPPPPPPLPPSQPPKFPSSIPSLTSRSMLPPKTASFCVNGASKEDSTLKMSNLTSVPDTLVKLMEYGDGDDDDDDDEADENVRQAVKTNTNKNVNGKPFWAA